jgi:aminoglycoside phosphotransferase
LQTHGAETASRATLNLLSTLPPSWQRKLDAFHFEPIERGMSAARLFRLRGPSSEEYYLKLSPPDGLADFHTEVVRTRWLFGSGVRVPDVLEVCDNGRAGAAALMTAVSGSHPQEVRQPVADVIRQLARGLQALHSLAVTDCPFDESIAVRLARAREMIKEGRIDAEDFAERNRGRSPQAIYEQLVANTPPAEEIVVVHGDAKFDNLLIDDKGNIGFIDCGHSGRGDRYVDLEAVTSDIDEYFGASWNEKFALDYGKAELDSAKLRFFSDLYELF